ncbi:Tetratricopeptide repeat protein [Mariniblastus fucicola]|uniref:Tetratricopeptide repeat protein n=1 Tax=Mariniblastus fucicola TaxID=980251 RepID=A0A5B9P6T1_9BACT|nr:Tetratricopeptide repeat protein [Mariniblastus fucicola]
MLYGKHVAIDGRLGSMSRRDFGSLVDSKGGTLVELSSSQLDLIVDGAETEPKGKFLASVNVDRIPETELWESLGFIESEAEIGRLYTPAMLAELLNVPLSTVRRWHRRGLIKPLRQVKKLPYFDFEEVASARRIARLIAAGNTPADIEAKLSRIAKAENLNQRSLSQLSVIVEGKDVLLRQGDGLIEPGGQQVLPFDSFGDSEEQTASLIPIELGHRASFSSENDAFAFKLGDEEDLSVLAPDELIELAIELEDEGELFGAIDCYRSILMSTGPSADISFRIAELLYQAGDLSAARERYYGAVELEPSYVEARASLGCVLMELGETEMAISCFEGTLDQHPDYPDVHFHLAKLLTESGRADEAKNHWEAFLQLAPKSPWAEEARSQLGEESSRG